MADEKHWLKRIKIQSRIDKDFRSLKPEEKLTYEQAVLKIYNDYEATVFNLSEQSANESIESIKNMSLGQRLKFQELISKRNRSQNTQTNGREI